MPEFKMPRQAIPCSADPDYINPVQDHDDLDCYPPMPHPHPEPKPHPKPKPYHKKEAAFACGNGSGLSLPVNGGVFLRVTESFPYSFTPLVAGTVTVDTSKMVDPTVKIDFSSIVNFLIDVSAYQAGILITIDFRLSKICDGSKVPLGTWTYHKSVNAGGPLFEVQSNGFGIEVDFREAFNFSWCECQDCPGCCTYVVEIVNFNSYDVASASLTNVSISALAVG